MNPRFQPDYIDPDSQRRSYNRRTLDAVLDEQGRIKARGDAA